MDDYKPLFFVLIYMVIAFLKKKKKKAERSSRDNERNPLPEKKKSGGFDFQNMIENLKEEVQKEFSDTVNEVPYDIEPAFEAVKPEPTVEKKGETFSEGSNSRLSETRKIKNKTVGAKKPSEIKSVLDRLGRHSPLAQGVIMAEILGKPVSLRE